LTTLELPALNRRIAQVFALDPSARALEFEQQWYTWGDLTAAADAIAPLVEPGERVAVLLRNRPAQVGLVLGLLRAGACVVTANPDRGTERARADVASLGVGTIAGAGDDLEAFAPKIRWLASDKLGVIDVSGDAPADIERREGVAVEMLTSGTTGVPKRVPLTYDMFSRVLLGAKYYERNADTDVRLRSGVTIVNSPMVHLGGLFRIATDHPDYGRELDTLLETVPSLERLEWAEHGVPPPTNYEIKYLREGRPIWRFLLRRRA